MIDCVYLFETAPGLKICVLGHTWPCETDGSICGDYESGGEDDEIS